MNISYPVYYPQFYTATIIHWKQLLAADDNKDIIIDSFRFLVADKRIVLNAYVIMSNHIHVIWQPLAAFTPADIQASFMKHTARQLIISLDKNNAGGLDSVKVNKYDRSHQVWKREPLSVELRTHKVFMQKLHYIHDNPVKAGLCIHPEDYQYSSAKFYYDGTDPFDILTHYSGN